MLDLWLAVQQGDTVAFNELYNENWESVYHTIYWRVCDEDIAKDLLQEVFIALWEKKETLHINTTIEGYLKVMARHQVIRYFRSETVRSTHHQSAHYHTAYEKDTVSEALLEKEILHKYQQEVNLLSPKMRDIYLLNRDKGLSIEKIAANLDLSTQTVKNQLTAANKKIKLALQPYLENKNTITRRISLILFLNL
jgi:RNA polymerase sigma factor (sigma-70 family)